MFSRIKTHFGALAFLCSSIIGVSLINSNVSAVSFAECMNQAAGLFGSDYVNLYKDAFEERCTSASIASSATFGLTLPEPSEAFPESNGIESVSFSVIRMVHSSSTGDKLATYEVNTDYAGFSKDRLSCMVSSAINQWWQGESMTVDVAPQLFVGSATQGNPTAKGNVPYKSCLLGRTTACNLNELPFYVYKVTNVKHGDNPKARYNEEEYQNNETDSTNPIIVADDSPIMFNHKLIRNDAWPDNAIFLYGTYMRKISIDGETHSSDADWEDVAINMAGQSIDIQDGIDSTELELSSTPKKICSTVTHRNVKSLYPSYTARRDTASDTSDSTICVWVANEDFDPTANPIDAESNADDVPAVPNTGLFTKEDGDINTENILLSLAGLAIIAFLILGISRRIHRHAKTSRF